MIDVWCISLVIKYFNILLTIYLTGDIIFKLYMSNYKQFTLQNNSLHSVPVGALAIIILWIILFYRNEV